MRRLPLAAALLVAGVGGSVAAASVTSIDDAADAGRRAHRLAPPFRPDLDPYERVAFEMVDIVNLERGRRGLPVFQVDAAVVQAAAAHAADMAARRQMVHVGSDGSDAGERLSQEGFAWRTWGETIGSGFTTPQPLFDAWLESPTHREHLLSVNTYVGVGVMDTPDGVPYWTLVVAS